MAITPKQRAILEEAKRKREEIDMDFLVRSFASILIKQKPDVVVGAICKFMDEVSNVCTSAASTAGAEAVTDPKLDVDQIIDGIRRFLELDNTMICVQQLLLHALEAENHGEYGLFTYDTKDIGRKLEGMRQSIIQLRNDRAVKQRRGY